MDDCCEAVTAKDNPEQLLGIVGANESCCLCVKVSIETTLQTLSGSTYSYGIEIRRANG